jgi:hypothetical protein
LFQFFLFWHHHHEEEERQQATGDQPKERGQGDALQQEERRLSQGSLGGDKALKIGADDPINSPFPRFHFFFAQTASHNRS